jgi:prolyl oligopeptidase
MGEYGNPDVAADRAFIAKYSPYQNLRAGTKYPPVIIYTSTKDDRVHPGHARKFAVRLAEQGHAFDYYENIEGGHAGTANAAEHAYRAALMLRFARRELMGK